MGAVPPAEGANALLDQRRLSLALRSAAAVLFAIGFLWPALTDATLIRLFAAYAFIDGILILSPGGWSLANRPLWPLLIAGCTGIAAAVAAYVWPGLDLLGLGNLMAVWSIALAASFTLGCATMREADPDHLLLLSAIAAGIFGRALLSNAAADAVVMSTWMGLYSLTLGILLFKLTLQRYRPIMVDLSV